MDKNSYKIRLNQWTEIIEAANASGLSRSEWCRQNGITKRTFYYWQRKVQDYLIENGTLPDAKTNVLTQSSLAAIAEQPVFCEITEPASEPVSVEKSTVRFIPEAVITCGSFSIMINEYTSNQTLQRLISALRHD